MVLGWIFGEQFSNLVHHIPHQKVVVQGISNRSIPELTDDSVASSSSSNPWSSCAGYSHLPCGEVFLGIHWCHGRAHLISSVNLFMSYKHLVLSLNPWGQTHEFWVLSHLCPLGKVTQPFSAYLMMYSKEEPWSSCCSLPFWGTIIPRAAMALLKHRKNCDRFFLSAARRCSSRWHCCTRHSWFHLVFSLARGLAFIFLSQNVLFHFLWEEETSPFLYEE